MDYETRVERWIIRTLLGSAVLGMMVIAVFTDWQHPKAPANGVVIVVAAFVSILAMVLSYFAGARRIPRWLQEDPAMQRFIESMLRRNA
jgi:drug/metabolite transporter (DMT)-like permease